jgi:ATP phosphoribosyltransferase
MSIFKRSGINITQDKRGLLAKSDNFPLDLLFVRDDDISNLVDAGVAALGLVGTKVYVENASKSRIIKELGFGKCFLALAVPNDSPIKTIHDLDGKRIATSYRRSTLDFLRDHHVTGAKIIDIAGSVEIAPLIDYADAIVDLVSTGSSLQQNKLTVLDKIFESQSIMIINRNIKRTSEKKAIIDRLLDRIDSYLTAKQYKRVLMDVPKSCLEKVVAEISGSKKQKNSDGRLDETMEEQGTEKGGVMRAPVVLPVYGFSEWCSLQVIMDTSSLWKKIEALKEFGVVNIVFDDIEGIVK